MPSQPKPLPLGSPHLSPHLNHLSQLWGTSQGACKGLSRTGCFLLFNQPPLPRGLLNQPRHHPLPRLPRAGDQNRTAANRNLALHAVQQPPPAPGRANENSQPGQQLRRSARLTPRACAIKSPPQPAAAQLRSDTKMARTYPSPWIIISALGVRKTLTPFQVFSWKTCTVATRNT